MKVKVKECTVAIVIAFHVGNIDDALSNPNHMMRLTQNDSSVNYWVRMYSVIILIFILVFIQYQYER